jgi:hypothetical protein
MLETMTPIIAPPISPESLAFGKPREVLQCVT